ncbi:hypothetical protein RHAB21_04526 [Pseudorhizobium halotolerans]|uniref:LTXXQ motif family protein n=1 Tax=Pseudorhizobium halotolerans TaxID=1233081 RepID=A0ABM8PXC1_9HYPH|nr:Spy/CpxP family protein refolding chaperone [Pseudorhizobium halotolerans]CAD7053608.1 hypothetical protein RHAB21_04526 [Pseudorhizobium halotolerans]
MTSLVKTILAAALLLSTPALAEEAHHKPSGTAESLTGDMAPQAGASATMSDSGASGMMGGDMMKMMEQMMRGMRAGGIEMDASGPMRQMMSPEHVEGRIAFLRTELKVTDAQQPLWEVVAEVLRANSIGSKGMMPAMMGGMMQPGASSKPLPQTLADLERMLSSRLDSLRRLNSALEPFYESLDETQKKTADELLMPMGMM